MYIQSNGQYPQNERFVKVFRKMNSSSYQDRASVTHLPQSSTDSSFYGEKSVGFSDERDMKSMTPVKTTKLQPQQLLNTRSSMLQMDQQTAMCVLFRPREVQINRQRQFIRTQFIPTSNGLKFILRLSLSLYLNLSWLHSVQQLQKTKLLILYYDMYHLSATDTKNKYKLPKIQSVIVEFGNEKEMVQMLKAIGFVHAKYHDEDVEKLYHLLCGGDQQKKQ